MPAPDSLPQEAKRGAEDSGQYFRYMAEFVGFSEADAEAVRQSKPVVEKHLPEIVAAFYTHLLRYPPTRKFFLKKDGSLDHDYIELRMRHLTNFWLRTADGVFDEDYARYVDYVGRAHTSHGADPKIYIAERYVIGQVGFMQHAISRALNLELRNRDDDLEFRAVEAWDKLMMVILELLARAYGNEREAETYDALVQVDAQMVSDLASHAVAHEHGEGASLPTQEVIVAAEGEIPDGERKIVAVGDASIGVFHHKGTWVALRNSCVHRGGPVATGRLVGDVLTCPWHGFTFDVTTGQCLLDPGARLDTYPVTVRDGQVVLSVPAFAPTAGAETAEPAQQALQPNEFRMADLPSGSRRQVKVNGQEVLVYNVEGTLYATQNACTHAGGPLSEGDLDGFTVTCFLHGSQFDIRTGEVLAGPATQSLARYRVEVDGELGRAEPLS